MPGDEEQDEQYDCGLFRLRVTLMTVIVSGPSRADNAALASVVKIMDGDLVKKKPWCYLHLAVRRQEQVATDRLKIAFRCRHGKTALHVCSWSMPVRSSCTPSKSRAWSSGALDLDHEICTELVRYLHSIPSNLAQAVVQQMQHSVKSTQAHKNVVHGSTISGSATSIVLWDME
ncbi:hypothetical protein GUJ93_ZPchr0008g12649 [Zizania palustris]|uniref:Uncharacterized protein n=1 Tax=Zizania palustris TaxID=103762 RepID=A0A8J5RGQ0_ZIZPA|nr:hypothetical protein GUJ93_ZPchr0008g12649 [Zizania palustris]